jgi:adenosylcobinamide-GDP ribazoletransferase
VAHAASPWWAPIAGSIGFLTIIPAPHVALTPAIAGRSLALFPLIGALIGGILGIVGVWLDTLLPAGPIAALLLAASALITGGLHLDGLMDTADGLGGGRSPEQRLAIMSDSRVGAFGALAGCLVLLGQFACLSELTGHSRFIALVVAGATSRWAIVLALAFFPAARRSGLGATFQQGATRGVLLMSTLFVVVGAFAGGQLGIMALAASGVVAVIAGRMLTRRLDGLSGDGYGAIAVITETIVLFMAVALAPR